MRCGGSWAVAWGHGFCVAEPALPSAYARGGGVIFEGRADKPLGVVEDKPYPGRDKFRQNVRRGKFLRCALRGKKVLAKTRGGANKPCIAPETSPARSLSKGQRKRAALSGSFFATIPNMRFPFIVGAVCLLAVGCAPSLQKHQNQLFARFVAQAHVGCSADEECTAVLLSCRYPQWGYAAINRLELGDVKRIRQADWYTRCKKEPPPADEIPTRCVAGRCRLVNP